MWYIGNVPIVEENHALIISQFVFTILAFICVVLRIFTRVTLVKNLGFDDYFIIAALLGTIAYFTSVVYQIKYGLGYGVELDVIQQFLQSLLSTIISYSFTHLCVKFSILLQCKRIFTAPVAQRVFLALIVWMTIYGLFCLLSSIVTCVPIEKYWDDSIPGGCLDRSILHYALAGFNIINDIALLVAPMPWLKNLQVAKRAKIALIGVFACGSFACIVAIVRLHSLWVNNSAPIQQQPIKGVAIAIWSGLEINVAIICASVPALKPFFVKVFPAMVTSLSDSKRSRTDRSMGASHQLRSFDNRSHAFDDNTTDPMEIKVQQSFEMKAVAVTPDDGSEKQLVTSSGQGWTTECYAAPGHNSENESKRR